MATLIEALAGWAAGLKRADIPDRVVTAAMVQLRSVLASIYAGEGRRAARTAREAALALGTRGHASVLPAGQGAHPMAAVLANAALSMAHDFDDYLFLGHTGHSAVLAPLAMAEELDASLEDMLVAQVIGNELAGRLGAYVAIGPQNGQLWAHIHLAAAAVAAARLRGLSADRIADALAIAFYQPPFTLFHGFMASEAKVLTAAQPAAAGIYAAELAARGLGGAHAMLEHPQGFGRHFAIVAVPQVIDGLGTSWVSDSLSCKIYPGCAYIDGPVDAALAARGDRGLAVRDIEAVDLEGTVLTAGMEAIAEASAPETSLDPIPINFSARRSVAIALLAGALTPRQVEGPWLAEHAGEVRAVAARVRVRASTELTTAMFDGIGRAVPLPALVRSVGLRRFWDARARFRDTARSTFAGSGSAASSRSLGWREALGALGVLLRGARGGGSFDMSRVDFRRLEFRFGARAAIRLRGGATLEAECVIPVGAAGRPAAELLAVVQAKLRTEAAAAGAPERADAIEEVLAAPAHSTPARALAGAVTGRP